MRGKLKAFFWEFHGMNSTWDPVGFCHWKREVRDASKSQSNSGRQVGSSGG